MSGKKATKTVIAPALHKLWSSSIPSVTLMKHLGRRERIAVKECTGVCRRCEPKARFTNSPDTIAISITQPYNISHSMFRVF